MARAFLACSTGRETTGGFPVFDYISFLLALPGRKNAANDRLHRWGFMACKQRRSSLCHLLPKDPITYKTRVAGRKFSPAKNLLSAQCKYLQGKHTTSICTLIPLLSPYIIFTARKIIFLPSQEENCFILCAVN